MKLNKRDKTKYKEFLEEIKKYKDKTLQVYSYIIMEFLENNYNSNDSSSYDIDDFIQEAYIILYSKQEQIEEVDNELNNLYNKMNKNEVDKKERIIMQIDIIRFINSLDTEEEKNILKSILLDEEVKDIASRLNVPTRDIKRILIKLLRELRNFNRENEPLYNTKKR